MKKLLIPFLLLFVFVGRSQEVQVSFSSDNLVLDGTLALPNGSAPFSTVVLVHGSGPNDRDQTLELVGGNAACLFPNLLGDTIRNFKDISDSLVQKGFAVFRYDKRSFTHGAQLDPKTASPNDFITDIHNAIDFLKTRAEVDSNCISLLGHSQGANLVPVVANQRNDINSVICLGTPATRIDTLMAQQFRDLYIICLNDSVTGNTLYNQTLSDFASIRNGSWNANTPYLGAYPLFWNDWMDISEASISELNALSMPFSIIHGEDDFNVPLMDYQKLQSEITNSWAEFSLMAGMNHYFTSSTYPHVHTDVINTMSTFFKKLPCVITSISETNSSTLNVILKSNQLVVDSEQLIQFIKVFDVTGKLCLSIFGRNSVNAEILNSGIYMVQVQSSSELKTLKVFIP